jgi:small subunit ribosomal protein S1
VGQEVEVEVLDVDLERERVSLSLKATQEDPWKEFERTSTAGSIIDGQVTKLVPFGAFVRVAPGIEGLVHISEISHEHVDSPESVLSVGDAVKAKVIDVDVSRRRVSLSMRQVTAAPPREPEIKAEPEQRREPAPEMVSTIQIPDDILAAVAQADAARATDPEPAVAEAPAAAEETAAEEAAVEAVEEAAVEEAVVEAVEQAAVEEAVEEAVTEAVVEEAIEEAQVEEAVAVVVAEEAVDDAIVAEEAGDAETAVEDEAVAEAAVEEAEEAADDEVSLEAILEDLKRREGRND